MDLDMYGLAHIYPSLSSYDVYGMGSSNTSTRRSKIDLGRLPATCTQRPIRSNTHFLAVSKIPYTFLV